MPRSTRFQCAARGPIDSRRSAYEEGNGLQRTALITGIAGQDGSYLSELLVHKGYLVHGLDLRPSPWLDDSTICMHQGTLTDSSRLESLLTDIRPDEVYNLAARSHVGDSLQSPIETAGVTALGALHLLEAVSQYQQAADHEVRFFQAASGEIFAPDDSGPVTEQSRVHPRNPYACAKAYAYWQTINYRESRGLFCVNGLLFNHESPRRREDFVTRKISRAAGRIRMGLQDDLVLGNLDVRRDWGFAGDYADAMWRMLQMETACDLIIATGQTHSVREFAKTVFAHLNLDWREYVRTDPGLFRPNEIPDPVADPSRARRLLDWKPTVEFAELTRMMAESDLELARAESQQSGVIT